jgi:anti-sigma factor RsiW
MREPVPERLIAAARGERVSVEPSAKILPFKRGRVPGGAPAGRSWWLGLPLAAASLLGLLLGGAVSYLSVAKLLPGGIQGKQPAVEVAAADNLWLDNAAGYFKLAASAGDGALIDVPATGDPREALQKISQSLPQGVRLPDLKPWGLTFQGARLVVSEGRPAAQLVYTTDNKAIGPLTLIIGSSKQPDIPPTLARRQDVNLLYWRRQGRAYALVGQTDIGYLWGIANDVAWQLDAV